MVAAVSAQDVLRCVVCGGLSPAALLLDCLHSCCEACAASAARLPDASAVACPKCREVSSFSLYGPNRVAELLAVTAGSSNTPTAGGCHADKSVGAAASSASYNAGGDDTVDNGASRGFDSKRLPPLRELGGSRFDAVIATDGPPRGGPESDDCLGSGGISASESPCRARNGCQESAELLSLSPQSLIGTAGASMTFSSAAAGATTSERDHPPTTVVDSPLQRRWIQPSIFSPASAAAAVEHAHQRPQQQQPTPHAPLCTSHGERCNLLCMQCRALMCSTCIRPCLDGKHEVEHRDGKRASEFVRGLADSLSRWLGELEERTLDGNVGCRRNRRLEAASANDDGSRYKRDHAFDEGDNDDEANNDDRCDSNSSRVDPDDSSRCRQLDDLQAARRAACETLLHNKRSALAAIERAYGAASEAVDRLADRLAADAGAAAAASASLGDRARQAVAYGRCLLGCGDLASLLQQYELLVSRAQLLLDEYGGRTPLSNEPRGAAAADQADGATTAVASAAGDVIRRCFVLESALPNNLDEICQKWIGAPRLISVAAAKSASPRCDGQPSHRSQLPPPPPPPPPPPAPQPTAIDGGSGHRHSTGGAAAKSSIGLRVLGGSLSMPVKCCDVAITASGHLLLAAKDHGIKEYDLRGREMSSWAPRPPAEGNGGGGGGRADSASTIDVLHDGRLAVGLSRSRCVVLLRRCNRASALVSLTPSATEALVACHGDERVAVSASGGEAKPAMATSNGSGDTWIEDGVVARLQSEPRRTSVFADVLAIAEGVASSRLVLVCLPRAHELLRRELGYCIECVAVAGQTVVTASYDKLEQTPPTCADGGGSCDRRKSHVIECYSFSGERLWRRPTSRLVRDLCPTPSGTVLYLALCESRAVSAIRADDGTELADVLSSESHGIQKPLRLSIGRGHRALLAVLNSDCKTVTVYTAADVRRTLSS